MNRIIIEKTEDNFYKVDAFNEQDIKVSERSNELALEYIDMIHNNVDSYKMSRIDGTLNLHFDDKSKVIIKEYDKVRNDSIFLPLEKRLNKIVRERKKIKRFAKKLIVPVAFTSIIINKIFSNDSIVQDANGFQTSKSVMENNMGINLTEFEYDKVTINNDNFINDSSDYENIQVTIDDLIKYDDTSMQLNDKGDFLVSSLPCIRDYIPTFGLNINDDRVYNTKDNWRYSIEKYCDRYGIDYNLYAAIISQESGGNPDIRGGLAQITMSWANKKIDVIEYDDSGKSSNSVLYITESMIKNPETNLQIGCAILQYCIRKFEGNIYAATLSYNLGEGTVRSIIHNYCNRLGKDFDDVLSDNYDYGWFYDVVPYVKSNNISGDPNYINNVYQFVDVEEFNYMCGDVPMNVLVNKEGKLEYNLQNGEEQIKKTTNDMNPVSWTR